MQSPAAPPAVGRLLRSVRDCQLFHLERAMDALAQRQQDDRRASHLVTELGASSVLVADAKGQERVLALSDHKTIANLQSLLDIIAQAYSSDVSPPTESSRNLVVAVVATLMTQATRGCTVSKRNSCVWGLESRKLLCLVYWIARLEAKQQPQSASASDNAGPQRMFLRLLILDWIRDATDKTRQLTACLVLFELLQLHRRAIRDGNEPVAPLIGRGGGDTVELIGALRQVVEQGSVHVKGDTKKPTALGLAALETLIMVCSDAAISLLPSRGAEEAARIDIRDLQDVVDAIRHALSSLLDWHGHAPRRLFLVVALRQLQSVVRVCSTLASSDKIVGHSGEMVTEAAARMLLWHWQATAPLLCTRSDSVIHICDSLGPVSALESTLEAVAAQVTRHEAVRYDFQVARLRQLCILLDLVRATSKSKWKEGTLVFSNVSWTARSALVVFLVKLLSQAIERHDEIVIEAVDTMLRSLLIGDGDLIFASEAQEEVHVVVSQLVGCLLRPDGRASVDATKEMADISSGDNVRLTVEELVADIIIARQLPISILALNLLGNEPTESIAIQKTLSLTRTLLRRVESSATGAAISKLWRTHLTPWALKHLESQDAGCQRMAALCLPLLNPVQSVFHALASPFSARMALSVVSFLLRNSAGQELDDIVSALVDLWRFGDSAFVNNLTATTTNSVKPPPAAWWNQHYLMHKTLATSTASDRQPGPIADKSTQLAFGTNGWCHNVVDLKARSAIVRVVLRKILGSPRDATLFKIVRELAAAGWIQGPVFYALVRPLVDHMLSQDQLRDELLVDDSAFSGAAVEALLFARLAPILVLRVLSREAFCRSEWLVTTCENEDEGLAHLLRYREHHEDASLNEEQEWDGISATTEEKHAYASVMKDLFHVCALQILNPLEFKEVKMLTVEILAKLPVDSVLPFTLSHLVAFARDEFSPSGASTMKLTLAGGVDAELPISPSANRRRRALAATVIPQSSCGLVAAKLLVYYLNRVLGEGSLLSGDDDTWTVSKVLGVLFLLLHISCEGDGSDTTLLADLQLGCIDWVAQMLLPRTSAGSSGSNGTDLSDNDWHQLVELLVDKMVMGDAMPTQKSIVSRHVRLAVLVQEQMRQFASLTGDHMPLQFRICCCNILISSLRKLDEQHAASVARALVIARRVVDAIGMSNESELVAGGLELLFTFLYKFAVVQGGDTTDAAKAQEMASDCFSIVLPLLAAPTSDKVAMGALKVVGALVGRVPQAIAALPTPEFQRLGSCLAGLRDRGLSQATSELCSSLLAALFPPSIY